MTAKWNCLLLSLILLLIYKTDGKPLPLNAITLPPGFEIQVFANNVTDARSLCIGDQGTVFVGSRTAGNVYALPDKNHDNKADSVIIIARGKYPNGVAFFHGSLYVAEISRVVRYDSIESHLDAPPNPVVIRDDFPTDQHHGWKFVRFGPDSFLYVPIGAPCNECLRKNKRFATITRMHADGSSFEIFASGIRNTVGFDWNPSDKTLWFTDNGRDNLGDTIPPDELNHAPESGMNFGYPYCHGNGIIDPELGKGKSCSEFSAPVYNLPAHVAALGMRFYTGKMFPQSYSGSIFIAEHGSWNRSSKIGYRITFVKITDGKVSSYNIFAQGWLQGQKEWGRPVDIEVMHDGSLLVSDDLAGAIYRISKKD